LRKMETTKGNSDLTKNGEFRSRNTKRVDVMLGSTGGKWGGPKAIEQTMGRVGDTGGTPHENRKNTITQRF